METTIIKKKGYGRKKIEIKKIENRSKLQVTFSKRRTGLFKKAAEFSGLCGANVAVIVQSPAGKFFATSAGSSINSIVDQYLSGASSSGNNGEVMQKTDTEKEEKKGLLETEVDNLNLHELEEYLAAMKNLKKNVQTKVEEKAKTDADVNVASSSSLISDVTLDCSEGLPVSDCDLTLDYFEGIAVPDCDLTLDYFEGIVVPDCDLTLDCFEGLPISDCDRFTKPFRLMSPDPQE